ncbi:MAG TPA: hypothetical protein VKM72_11505 [Thermoanaerobaculia bacterium]|nr:hypothetical protein [Thermoanaerobaculia bacterium]
MRSSMLIPMTALTLTLSMSPALQAQSRRAPDRYNDRYDNRYDTRYDSRRAAALAEEIEQTAYFMRREAERNNRRPDRWESRMLSALRELNQEANQFHARVDDRRYNSNRSDRDFQELVRAFRETGNVLDRVDSRPYLDRGMDKIGDLLSELSGYYGRRSDYRYDRRGSDRYGRDGRYGRDRYDRDDRWDDDHN